jgi:hypothetical protein
VDVRLIAADYKDIGPKNIETSSAIRLSVKSITEIEQALQHEIDQIKQVLTTQRKKQGDEIRRAEKLERSFGSAETLSPEQVREVREAKLEQSGIVSRLEAARLDILQVKRRGVYNRIFNDTAAEKLRTAARYLRIDPDDEEEGSSSVDQDVTAYRTGLDAVQSLEYGSASRSASERESHFNVVVENQKATFQSIQDALDQLEKWANYQEVIRMTREILEAQKKVNDQIRGLNPK